MKSAGRDLHRTSTLKIGHNQIAEWGESGNFSIHVDAESLDKVLEMEVWDKDAMNKDDLMGVCNLGTLRHLLNRHDIIITIA